MESTENGNFCGHAIISHKEDLDGIIAATLLTYVLDKSKNFPNPEKKYGKNGRKETPSKIKKGHLSDHNNKSCLYLIGYPGFPGLIEKLRKGGRQVSLIIADLGMSPDTIEVLHKFVKNMGAEKSTRCQHYYFDHHILPDGGETTIKGEKNKKAKNLLENFKIHHNLDKCASEIIYEYFSNMDTRTLKQWNLEQDFMFPKHFGELVHLAHLLDFTDEAAKKDPLFKLGENMNLYITYNQTRPKKLHTLVSTLSQPEQYKKFKNRLPNNIHAINDWIKNQYLVVEQNRIECFILGYKVISSFANIRAGKSSRHLLEKNPEAGLCIGVSIEENNVNIRSDKFMIMDQLSMRFGGGGHKDRAGFILPKKFQTGKDMDKIHHRELLTEICKVFGKMLKDMKEKN